MFALSLLSDISRLRLRIMHQAQRLRCASIHRIALLLCWSNETCLFCDGVRMSVDSIFSELVLGGQGFAWEVFYPLI